MEVASQTQAVALLVAGGVGDGELDGDCEGLGFGMRGGDGDGGDRVVGEEMAYLGRR